MLLTPCQALEFLVNIDELLFEAIMPEVVKQQVASTTMFSQRAKKPELRKEFRGAEL